MDASKTDLTSKMRYDYLVKIKMVGDSAVGKSSIVMRFCDDSFTDNTMPTIGNNIIWPGSLGVDYKSKIFDVENKKVKATIWDTGKSLIACALRINIYV